jgi:hypothetical protein
MITMYDKFIPQYADHAQLLSFRSVLKGLVGGCPGFEGNRKAKTDITILPIPDGIIKRCCFGDTWYQISAKLTP